MTLSPETEVPRLEREWMEAWLGKDRDACDRILAHDFVLTSARGLLLSKAEWLAAAGDTIVGLSFDWDEIQVRDFGHVAIVHARSHQCATVAGTDWSGTFLLTDVWVHRDGRWQVVSRHGTGPLAEPEAQA